MKGNRNECKNFEMGGDIFHPNWNTFYKFKFLPNKYFLSWIWSLCLDVSWILI